MAKSLGWDVIVGYVDLPDTGETVNSSSFSTPRNTTAVTFHVPLLLGVNTMLKIQSLDPVDKITWRDVVAYNPTTGLTMSLNGIIQNTATTFYSYSMGGGIFRLVANNTQVASPTTISITFKVA
jgi:hypothetical protein